jgi:hypothetical protein
VDERRHEPRPAHPQRVADRDRAAIDIHTLGIEPQLPHHDQRLTRERLIELDEVEVRR